MAIDTNERLEMMVEADSQKANKELEKLVMQLDEVIAKLKKTKSQKNKSLLPGLEEARKNIIQTSREIYKLNTLKAIKAPESDDWKKVGAAISDAGARLEQYKATAKNLLETMPSLKPAVTGIKVTSNADLAYAQERIAQLETAIKRNRENQLKYQFTGDIKRFNAESKKLLENTALLRGYENAIRSTSAAWYHFEDAEGVNISTVEELEAAERAAKKLERSIENDTLAMKRFATSNDAAGVERMKEKIESSTIALERYRAALNGADIIKKQRDNLAALASLYDDIEKKQKRIGTLKGSDDAFIYNSSAVRRLKMELLNAQIQANKLNEELGEISVREAAIQGRRLKTKGIAMAVTNTALLNKEARKANKAFINMTKTLSLMAFRSTIRTIMRLTKEGVQNLALYSKETDNLFNGSMSRMLSKVTQLKNAFATAIAPVFQAAEPIMIRFINTLIEGINNASLALAAMFGQETFYKALPVSEDYAESLDQAANNAKELKKQLLGIDELTILEPNTTTDKNPGKADPSEMFTIEKVGDYREKANKLLEVFQEIATIVGIIGVGIAGWKITASVADFASQLTEISKGTVLKKGLGITFMLTGVALEYDGLLDIFKGNAGFLDYMKAALGTALGIGGALLFFGTGPLGWSVGIGLSVVTAIVAWKVAEKQKRESSAAYREMQKLKERAEERMEFAKEVRINIQTRYTGYAELQAEYDSYLKIIDKIFLLNDMPNKTAADLALLENYVNIVNGLGLEGLHLEFDTATGKIKQTKEEVYGVIEALRKQALMEAAREMLTETYKEQLLLQQQMKDAYTDLATASGIVAGKEKELAAAEAELKKIADEGAKTGRLNEAAYNAQFYAVQKLKGELAVLKGGQDSVYASIRETSVAYRESTELVNALEQELIGLSGAATNAGTSLGAAGTTADTVKGKVASLQTQTTNSARAMTDAFKTFGSEVSNARKELDKIKSFSGGRISLNVNTAQMYASGGFPSTGEVFVAREAGPEMVGRIGGKTAVANNDQIVAGIAAGVSSANGDVVTAIYSMAQRVVTAIEENGGDIVLDGKKVGQKTTSVQNRQSRMYNKTVLEV